MVGSKVCGTGAAGAGRGTRPLDGTDRLIAAVSQSFSPYACTLPDAFFPAHLSVALIDAVFALAPACGPAPTDFAGRYCRRFGLVRVRVDRWNVPSADAQETLEELIGRYERLGSRAMEDTVFRTRGRVPGTDLSRARWVVEAAAALRRIGIDVLQDVHERPPRAIRDALRALPGDAAALSRRLLMYTGDDDFVLADRPVRVFVARATGRRSVTRADAAALVRRCAHELLVSPRYIDARIRGEVP